MAALAPPVAAIRTAVRRALISAGTGRGLVLVACSGGPDSLALAAAARFVAPRLGWRAGLVTVDHGLQPGSDRVAEQVGTWAGKAGLDPVEVLPVRVAGQPPAPGGPVRVTGRPGGPEAAGRSGGPEAAGRSGGPEAAARSARYEALADACRRHGAAALLLGHTRDDQAETVLLALARGAGPRGLAGMPPRRDRDGVAWLRPLLDITRAQTHAACAALGLEPWHDPHNTDPSYARSRVRATALPALVDALGGRVVDNLARTARQLAADTAALDALAAEALAAARTPADRTKIDSTAGQLGYPPAVNSPVAGQLSGSTVGEALAVSALRELPAAIRTRVLHAWARELGAPGSALSHRHVAALDALVTDWHGQGPTYLPGGTKVTRRAGLLLARWQ